MPQAMLEEMILEEARKIIVSRMRKPGGLIRDIAILFYFFKVLLHREGCFFIWLLSFWSRLQII